MSKNVNCKCLYCVVDGTDECPKAVSQDECFTLKAENARLQIIEKDYIKLLDMLGDMPCDIDELLEEG